MGNFEHFNNGPYTERVKQLVAVMQANVGKGKSGEQVTPEDWEPLEALIDVENFERIGPFHDAVDWQGYLSILNQWVNHAEGWEPVVKRVTETPGLVFVQCEEMITNGDRVDPFYSLSLYDFDDDMKIRRIQVYMQMESANPQGK